MQIPADAVSRFFEDDDFRAKTLKDPRGALAEYGVDLTDEQHHALKSLDPVHLREIEDAIKGGDPEAKAMM